MMFRRSNLASAAGEVQLLLLPRRFISCTSQLRQRSFLSSAQLLRSPISRPYSTGQIPLQHTQVQIVKKRSLLRRFFGFSFIAVLAFSTGFTYNLVTMQPVNEEPPSNEEVLALFTPEDENARKIDDYIQSHPLALSLRSNPHFTEERPHAKMPETFKARSLTAGTLAGPDRIVVPPYTWSEDGGKSFVSIFYLGSDVSGHPGIVHGGLLATLLDEGLARCCFPALPNGVGVTANLNIDYRSPALAGSYFVLKATTTKVEGRKAWVEGRIETLTKGDEEPTVLVEAKALFVEPKNAGMLGKLYKAVK